MPYVIHKIKNKNLYSVKNKITGIIVKEENLSEFPKLKYGNKAEWMLLYEISSVNLSDIIQCNEKLHPNIQHEDYKLIISNDGVPESKSSSISLDVISVKFTHCKTIFPWKILRTQKGFKLSAKEYFEPCIQDIIREKICVILFVLDAPKRAFIIYQKSHSGYFSCDYCLAEGEYLGAVIYGFHSIYSQLRTHKITFELACLAENNSTVHNGITGKNN